MISHANAERVANTLVVTWRGAPNASVFLSESPDDAGVDVRAPDAPGVATVELPDPDTRFYVHLFADGAPFVVVGERRLDLEGASNVRDLGGYPTPDGPTRWGRVFRADDPGGLTDRDVAYLQRLGVATVCDYRSNREVELSPSRLEGIDGVDWFHLPVSSAGPEQGSMLDRLKSGEVERFGLDDMALAYVRMLSQWGEQFAHVIRLVAEPDAPPTLFNCSGGKDRTGLTAALLLMLAGVGEAHVLDDYELSGRYLSADRAGRHRDDLAAAGVQLDAVEGLFVVRRSVLAAALAELRERHGSVETFLQEGLGLDDEVVRGVRRNLLGPAVSTSA